MKNLFKNLLLLTSVLSLTLMFSCGDEDPDDDVILDPPTAVVDVQVNGADATSPASVEVGDSVSAALEIAAPGNFNVFRVTIVKDGTTIGTREYPRTGLDVDDFTDFNANIVIMESIPDSLAGATLTLEFEVVDDANEIGTAADFVLNVADGGIVTQTETLLGGPQNASAGSFYDVVEDVVYNASDAFETENQANIDLVFWYGNTSMYAIGATDDANAELAFEDQAGIMLENLATRNETRFKMLSEVTVDEFDEVSTQNELLNLTGETGITETRVDQLEVDDIFAFRLDDSRDGKIGIAKVISTSGTIPAERAITIQVKVQE